MITLELSMSCPARDPSVRRSAARGLIGLAGGPLDHSVVDELRDQRDREAASENAATGSQR